MPLHGLYIIYTVLSSYKGWNPREMPILSKLNRAFYIAGLRASGYCRVLLADNVLDGKRLSDILNVTRYRTSFSDTKFRLACELPHQGNSTSRRLPRRKNT